MKSNVIFSTGQGGLPMLRVETAASEMALYLHGAHVVEFRKKSEPQPILWMSNKSRFESGKAIRGGVPVIFPWFGPREGKASHGFARTAEWELKGIEFLAEERVAVVLKLKPTALSPEYSQCEVTFRVIVSEVLDMELHVQNAPGGTSIEFEQCLHTYFTIGDIDSVSVVGLKSSTFVDRLGAPGEHLETGESIQISSEFDRTYQNTTAAVEIRDRSFLRTILVEKEGSRSTVVWNPWIEKSKALGEFEKGAYRGMICVESGCIGAYATHLNPGAHSVMKVRLSSRPGA